MRLPPDDSFKLKMGFLTVQTECSSPFECVGILERCISFANLLRMSIFRCLPPRNPTRLLPDDSFKLKMGFLTV